MINQTLYKLDSRPELNSEYFSSTELETLYYHPDLLNSTMEVTDKDGNSLLRYRYTPWGESYFHKEDHQDWFSGKKTRLPVEERFSRRINPYLFTGKPTNAETGFVHMDARFYDPSPGRFIQPDLYNFENLSLPQDARPELLRYMNLQTRNLLVDPFQQLQYGYVSGNPLIWVDPLGLTTTVLFVYDKTPNGITELFTKENEYGEHNSHTAIHIKNDDTEVLYDPGGSYFIKKNGEILQPPRDRVFDKESGGNTIKEYEEFHGRKDRIKKYPFETTPEEEERIIEKFYDKGNQGKGRCTRACSSAIEGIGPFKEKVTRVWKPETLEKTLKEIKKDQLKQSQSKIPSIEEMIQNNSNTSSNSCEN